MYKRIRTVREDKNLTRQQMAEALGCTESRYAGYELGEVDIPAGVLIQLAEFHGVSADYLLDLRDDPAPLP